MSMAGGESRSVEEGLGIQAREGLLVLITNSFPGGSSEPFLNDEIHHLAKAFRKVEVFTFGNDPVLRELPDNVERFVFPSLWDVDKKKRKAILLRNPGTLMKMLMGAVNENGLSSFLKMSKLLVNRAVYYFAFAEHVIQNAKPLPGERVTTYSYWGDDKAVIPALLRKRGFAHYAISRAHAFEIYDQTGIYNFYRDFQYRWLDRILMVSNDGLQTMTSLFPRWKSKYGISRLGTVDRGMNPVPGGGVFRICSCGSVQERKRILSIARVVGSLDFELDWVHFGSGDQFEELKAMTAKFPAHIKVDLRGHVASEEVLNYYSGFPVDLFVNFSTMEGIPVAIMEAASFGIPVIATSAGGIREIVNDTTGRLLDMTATEQDLRDAIVDFRQRHRNDQALRDSTRSFWLKNFHAGTNFSEFADRLAKGDF